MVWYHRISIGYEAEAIAIVKEKKNAIDIVEWSSSKVLGKFRLVIMK